MLKAIQALYTLIQSKSYKPTPVWPTVLTSIAAVVALFLTLLTIWNQGHTTEDNLWTDTVKQMMSKDSSQQIGVIGIQGFFDSNRHGTQSRQVASALLPMVDNKDIFDTVLSGLEQHTDEKNQTDLIGLARTVSADEWDMFRAAQRSEERPRDCPTDDDRIVVFLNHSEICFPYLSGEEPPKAKQAWLYSWELDSLSAAFNQLWQRPRFKASLSGLDLSGIIFVNTENDHRFKGVNFSGANLSGALCHLCDLTEAHFDETTILKGTVFHQILQYQRSTWNGAHWWESDSISCGLAGYLKNNYAPSDSDGQKAAQNIVKNCRDDKKE